MKCDFCQHEIPEDFVQKSCGRCLGGCRKLHCPFCGRETPLPPQWLRRQDRNDQTEE